MHKKWITFKIMNCNMSYNFNITIAKVQCKPGGNESYEGGLQLFNGKQVQAKIEHFLKRNINR